MSRVFVTGGAGFIGSHLVDRLISKGEEVTVYDNLSAGRMENISHNFGRNSFLFIKKDLISLPELIRAMAGSRLVFHIGANSDVRSGAFDTRVDLENGITATWNVLEAMRQNGIKQIVFASSASVYGETSTLEVKEDHGPLLPISLYGAAKIAAEALISSYCHTFGMQTWMFRFANIVGLRRRHGVVYDFVRKLIENPAELEILGDGNQCKPYLHVSECVDGILRGCLRSGDVINVFNLGVDSATDVNTIARMTAKEMGLDGVKFRYTGGDRGWNGDSPQLRFDMSRMKSLGWQARLSSDEAVVRAAREHIKELKLKCRQ